MRSSVVQRWAVLVAVLGFADSGTLKYDGLPVTGGSKIQSDVVPRCLKPPSIPNAFLSPSFLTESGHRVEDADPAGQLEFFNVGDEVTYQCMPGYVVGRAGSTIRVRCKEAKDGTPFWDVKGRCTATKLHLPTELHERKLHNQLNHEQLVNDALLVNPQLGQTEELHGVIERLENDHPRLFSSKRKPRYRLAAKPRFAYERLQNTLAREDCLSDGTCPPSPLPDPNEGKTFKKLKIADKFHSPFHEYHGIRLNRNNVASHNPNNFIFETPDLPRRYAGSRWVRRHPRVPPPPCDGPACDSRPERLAFNAAVPDQETRYPDRTEDVVKAALTGVLREGSAGGQLPAGGPHQPPEQGQRGSEESQGAGNGGTQHHPASFVPSRRRHGHFPQEHERFEQNFHEPCRGADCVRRPGVKSIKGLKKKVRETSGEILTVSKPYAEARLSPQFESERNELYELNQPIEPIPEPEYPPCPPQPECTDPRDPCCSFTTEGEFQGQYNPEFEEMTAGQQPYYPKNYDAVLDGDDCEPDWLDWLLEPKNLLKVVTACLGLFFIYSALKCALCSSPEEGGLEQDGGNNCGWNLLGDNSCAAGAVEDKSDDGCATDKACR